MTTCPEPGALVEEAVSRVLTQYRESPRLLFLIRTYLGAVEEAVRATCAIPDFFDLDTAVGDQLTIIGKRLGFPRRHCICATQPVFGFRCDSRSPLENASIGGFCDAQVTWSDFAPAGFGEIEIVDDEIYRGLLRARRYGMQGLYDVASLTAALRAVYGPQAVVIGSGAGRVVVAPGRPLANAEIALLQVVPRALPIAPGILLRYHFGTTERLFGFGEGWGGFCEPAFPDGVVITDGDGAVITVPNGDPDDPADLALATGPLSVGAPWVCPVDVKPYDCV